MSQIRDFLHRLVYNPYSTLVNRIMHFCPSRTCDGSLTNAELCIASVAFNRPDFVQAQVSSVKEYVADKGYRHVIIDNSSDKGKRKEISRICAREDVAYIPAPRFFHLFFMVKSLFGGGSVSHGLAINWFWQKVLPSINPHFIAFIDHDMMPRYPYSLISHIGELPFYGIGRLRGKGLFYLWPGFSVYNYHKINPSDFNFSPCYVGKTFLDTGGKNYTVFPKYGKPTSAILADNKFYLYDKQGSDADVDLVMHRNCIEIVDVAWLHIINGSNSGRYKGKERIVRRILDDLDGISRKLLIMNDKANNT